MLRFFFANNIASMNIIYEPGKRLNCIKKCLKGNKIIVENFVRIIHVDQNT